MQSLEEEALLKGALTIQVGKTRSTKGSTRRGETTDGYDDRSSQEGPQTDGDETDGYSDQVLHVPFVSPGNLHTVGIFKGSNLRIFAAIP